MGSKAEGQVRAAGQKTNGCPVGAEGSSKVTSKAERIDRWQQEVGMVAPDYVRRQVAKRKAKLAEGQKGDGMNRASLRQLAEGQRVEPATALVRHYDERSALLRKAEQAGLLADRVTGTGGRPEPKAPPERHNEMATLLYVKQSRWYSIMHGGVEVARASNPASLKCKLDKLAQEIHGKPWKEDWPS
jgi:hypothetical protein